MSIILYTLLATQLTIFCVTLYLHRSQAHRSVTFHPIVSHAMRFWLWFTTGMVTKQWVAIHRKHHRYSDQPGDPHSPHVWGIGTVLIKGALLYHKASQNKQTILQYGRGTPDDWIERNLYTPYSRLGITILLILNLCLFGLWGWIVWAIQMLWIPLWAAGVVNGLAHWCGYRNGTTRDQSRNLIPIAFWIGGEELHNNHHLNPASARLSRTWFEWDPGWLVICVLEMLLLAEVHNSDVS